MSNWIGEPVRLVVCAANRYGKLIITGARHFDQVMVGQLRAVLRNFETFTSDTIENTFGVCEQGFIDQYGVFMDRKEAYQVALAAGQLNTRRKKSGSEGSTVLFSEDLY